MRKNLSLFGRAATPPREAGPARPSNRSGGADDAIAAAVARGDAANRARDWAAAATAYVEALTRDPALAEIWVQYGHALKEQGALESAEAAYRRAIALRPGLSDPLLQLGHALKLRGRAAEALEAYAAAAACDEPHPEAAAERDRLAERRAAARPREAAASPPRARAPAALGPTLTEAVAVAPPEPLPGPPARAIRFESVPAAMRAATCRRAWLAAEGETLAATLAPRLAGRRVLSLDVFDTLLLRGSESEAARYVALSERIAAALAARPDLAPLALSPDDLLLARVEGLRESYRLRSRREGCGEGAVDEVHAYMARRLGGGPALALLLEAEEIAFEASVLAVNPALRRLVELWRADGGTVILLSDMYLRARHIGAIVERLDPALARMVDRVYSSADLLFSKRSGRIFAAVEADLGLGPGDFVHVGDASEGDVRMARRAGWAALHFPVADAEARARAASLAETVARLAERGLDIADWAQI